MRDWMAVKGLVIRSVYNGKEIGPLYVICNCEQISGNSFGHTGCPIHIDEARRRAAERIAA